MEALAGSLSFAQLFSTDLKLDRGQWEGRSPPNAHYLEVDALVSTIDGCVKPAPGHG